MSDPRPFGDGLCAAVRHYLQQNNKTHLGQINAEILSDLAERYFLHHEAQTKARKKKGDHAPEEVAIYEAYPRKVGREMALGAIQAALVRTDATVLLQATQLYSDCVRRWPASYRYKEGRDTVPYPASWFNAGRFADDPKEWLPAGLFVRPDDPADHPNARVSHQSLAEPSGWLEEFPNSTFKDWKEVPTDSKASIVAHMKKIHS